MKEYTFSNKSWHFKLANVGVQRVWDFEQIDICSYIRKVLAGAITFGAAAVAVVSIVTFFGYGFITLGIWLYECITTGVWVLPNPIARLMAISIMIAVFGCIIFGIKHLLEKLQDRYINHVVKHRHPQLMEEKEPSFIGAAYRKFKDKTCFRITFK